MKYFTIATVLTLASSALAAIRDVQLFAQSSNEEINNLGLISRREGAGVNYLFLAGGAETLKFDDETFTIFSELQTGSTTARQLLVVSGGVVQLSVSGQPLHVEIAEDGSVKFAGSDSVAAAKNINDPYNYSKDSFAVVTNGGEGSIPFKIIAKFIGGGKSSSVTKHTEAPTTSPVYSNKTVTVFTTYCPESTTITLIICSEVCTPTVIETSGSVTVSSVLPSSSTEAPPKTSVAAPSTTAEAQTTAPVTSYEGGANEIVGGGSMAIALAAAAIGLVI